MQGSSLRRGARPERCPSAISARAHPLGGADRDQLDGNAGWAKGLGGIFVEQGYVVYMIDQPMRGRSAWHPGDGATRMFTAQQEEFQFTANTVRGTWPQAKKHTQWPGEGPNKGQKGDPIFDAFYATRWRPSFPTR